MAARVQFPQQVINNLATMMDTYSKRNVIAYDDYSITKMDERSYLIKYTVVPYEMMKVGNTMHMYEEYCQKLNYYCMRTAKMLLALDAANQVIVEEYVMVYKDGTGELKTRMEFY